MSFENQPPAPVQAPKTTNAFAVVSMVMGILNFVILYGLGAILALVFGYIAKSQIKNSPTPQDGDGMATAGIVLGYVGIALGVLLVIVVVLLFALDPNTLNNIETYESGF